MSFTATVYRILIASPGDLHEERGIIEAVIHAWNALHSAATQVVLLPVRWEMNAVPEFGDRPQAILNRSIVHDCDLLIGAFWTRLGTPTGGFDSGTVEEIEQFKRAGKPVLLYFSSRQLNPFHVDFEQFGRLKAFRTQVERVALIDEFASPAELELKLSRHLHEHVRRLIGASPVGMSGDTAGTSDSTSLSAGTPSPASSQEAEDTSGVSGETGEMYKEYWLSFAAGLARAGSLLRPPTIRPKNWIRFSIGRGDSRIYAFSSARDHYLGVEFALDRPGGDQLFKGLEAERQSIDANLGKNVEWKEHPGSYRIVKYLPNADPADRAAWSDQHAWLREQLDVFQKVLIPTLMRTEGRNPGTGS